MIALFSRYGYLVFPGFLVILGLCSCKEKQPLDNKVASETIEKELLFIDSSKYTIETRFTPPEGYKREFLDKQSFAHYLRTFPLLGKNEKVMLYDGSHKSNQSVHESILDIDVGKRDLQQCADAVMRLRAEYLYAQNRFDEIGFDFTNGWHFEYSRWRAGNDLVINGNNTSWRPTENKKLGYNQFRSYLDWVFMYAGTLSLSRELKQKSVDQVEIGDVFIYGGSPGHAVIVMDMAVDSNSGDKAIMLAQSYMPAQQIHILKNMDNPQISPWYKVSEIEEVLSTPEWNFSREELKEW